MTEHAAIRLETRRVARTARVAFVGAPLQRAARVWIALHGYGMLADRFLAPFAGAIGDDTAVVAPEGLSRAYLAMPEVSGAHLDRVGANWITRVGREGDIVDTHTWLQSLHDEILQAAPSRPWVGVLGFSQGVASATRWVAAGGVRPQAFVAWAGSPAEDLDVDGFRRALGAGTPDPCMVHFVAGRGDRFITPERRAQAERFTGALGVPSAWHDFEGAHTLDAETLRRVLAWGQARAEVDSDPNEHPSGASRDS